MLDKHFCPGQVTVVLIRRKGLKWINYGISWLSVLKGFSMHWTSSIDHNRECEDICYSLKSGHCSMPKCERRKPDFFKLCTRGVVGCIIWILSYPGTSLEQYGSISIRVLASKLSISKLKNKPLVNLHCHVSCFSQISQFVTIFMRLWIEMSCWTIQVWNAWTAAVCSEQVGHADVVLDDIWTLDLSKLDGWKCVKENTEGEHAFKEESDWESDHGSGSDSQWWSWQPFSNSRPALLTSATAEPHTGCSNTIDQCNLRGPTCRGTAALFCLDGIGEWRHGQRLFRVASIPCVGYGSFQGSYKPLFISDFLLPLHARYIVSLRHPAHRPYMETEAYGGILM